MGVTLLSPEGDCAPIKLPLTQACNQDGILHCAACIMIRPVSPLILHAGQMKPPHGTTHYFTIRIHTKTAVHLNYLSSQVRKQHKNLPEQCNRT